MKRIWLRLCRAWHEKRATRLHRIGQAHIRKGWAITAKLKELKKK